MTRKYHFSENEYFKVPLNKLVTSQFFKGSLFIYLPKNDHLMLVKHEDAGIQDSVIPKLIEKKVDCFLCPIQYEKDWIQFIESLPAENQEEFDSVPPLATLSAIAEEIANAEDISDSEKEELLSEVSMELLQYFASLNASQRNEIDSTLEEMRRVVWGVLRKNKEAPQARAILSEADDFSLEQAHSVTTSTLAVMISLGLKRTVKEHSEIFSIAVLHGFACLNEKGKPDWETARSILSAHQVTSEFESSLEQLIKVTGEGSVEPEFVPSEMIQITALAEEMMNRIFGRSGLPESPSRAFQWLKELQGKPSPFGNDLVAAIVGLTSVSSG